MTEVKKYRSKNTNEVWTLVAKGEQWSILKQKSGREECFQNNYILNKFTLIRTIEHKIWVNIYEDRVSAFDNNDVAKSWSGSDCLETREITITKEF